VNAEQEKKLRRDRHGYRKMARNMAVLIENHLELDFKRTWFRADGGVICKLCGMPYSEHPVALTVFNLLCSGKLVKL
jgi:hypothetical protein